MINKIIKFIDTVLNILIPLSSIVILCYSLFMTIYNENYRQWYIFLFIMSCISLSVFSIRNIIESRNISDDL